MKSNSTYTKAPITEQDAKSGSTALTYELNGGAKVLAKLVERSVTQSGKSKYDFGMDAGLGKSAIYKYSCGRHTGITMGTLRKFAKAFDMSTFALSKKLKLSTSRKGKKNGAPEMSKFGELIEALGVNVAESSCSLTVGDERIVVERMPGQDRNQPVIVEHNGHRLTVEKV